MSRFQSGTFGPHKIKTKPIGWRARLPGYDKWSPPYLIGSRVAFEIEIFDTDARLFNLPFYAVNTSSKSSERIPLDSAKQEKKKIIDWYSTPSDGALQIWLGTPEGPESINIVHADTWNPTNLVIALVSSMATLLLTLTLKRILGAILGQ